MRKKTEPHTRKEHQASSGEKSGLIAKNANRRHSVETESVLDNRSHRTFRAFTKPRRRAQLGAGVSTPFTIYTFHGLPGKRATARAA